MRRKYILGALALAAVILLGQAPAWAQEQQAQQYTMAEYNAYQAAVNEPNPQQRIKLLDSFVATYPNSTLMFFIDDSFYRTYTQLGNNAKIIESADKMLTKYPDKLNDGARFGALLTRTNSFHRVFNPKSADANDQATRARAAAVAGLAELGKLNKPENVGEEAWTSEIQRVRTLFNFTIGVCAAHLKDYPAAIEGYKAALAADPKHAFTRYQLGLAYLGLNPPQHLDGFWSLAKAIALKMQGEAQVRNYLKGQMRAYQQTVCEAEFEKQFAELLALAATSDERPATYTFPSAADLDRTRADAGAFFEKLKAGGDDAKLVWLSVCGLEFPDVAVKVIEVMNGTNPGDPLVLKVFRAPTAEELEAGTEANMEIKVVDQPDAARVTKDSFVRFTGTLSGYQPEPFMLFWDKAKVNAEDIPEAKPDPAAKKAKKATKRPPAQQ